MAIDVVCQGCGQNLQVADSHAGKKARCPACQAITPVPMSPPPTASMAPKSTIPNPRPTSPSPEFARPDFSADPVAERPQPNPFAAPQTSVPLNAYGVPMQPHRGVAVLALSIVSFFVCGLIAIPAVVIGHQDLAAMNRGERDPSGRPLVIVGLVIGWIMLAMVAIGMLFFLFIFLAALAGK